MAHDEEPETRKVCKDLQTKFESTFSEIIEALRGMGADDGSSLYQVYWDICSTHEHGLPHHRERVYIVGLLASDVVNPFNFPVTTSDIVPLGSILSDVAECERSGHVAPAAAKNILLALAYIEANGVPPRVRSGLLMRAAFQATA